MQSRVEGKRKTQEGGTGIYPTKPRTLSRPAATSARNCVSMRRTAGIGYWKASGQEVRVLGSGASVVMVRDSERCCRETVAQVEGDGMRDAGAWGGWSVRNYGWARPQGLKATIRSTARAGGLLRDVLDSRSVH